MTNKFNLYLLKEAKKYTKIESPNITDLPDDSKNTEKTLPNERHINNHSDFEKEQNSLDFLKNKPIDESKVNIRELRENIFKYEKEVASKDNKSKKKK